MNFNAITEKDIEQKVVRKLEKLGYILDFQNPFQDVYQYKPKNSYDFIKLNKKKPDFIIYDQEKPLAIIETKKPHSNLFQAEIQAENYANILGIPIIFTYDGFRLFTKHLLFKQELQYGNTPLTDFIDKKTLKKFIQTPKIDFNFGKKITSETNFIHELKKIEDILWTTGLKKGDERFTEFCKILFLRLISEKENKNLWENIVQAEISEKIYLINGNLAKLNNQYQMGKYGEKLQLDPEYNNKEVAKIIQKLNEIDFTNTSLDIKGNAFEFFLGYRGLNDDLAQYFTPRNIIRFMCHLTVPRIGEKIYDPFCGSGGILINTFEYMKKQILDNEKQKFKILRETSIFGTDINNIAYVAKMNMILVGDGHANIIQQKDGSLINKRTSQYDVVMTNIPFNLPINKFDYHIASLYPVNSNNGNALCIQHCLDSLKKSLNSRACIVIPEQFIFHQPLKNIREYIINHYNVKIFSLPQGVFEPYTTAKTCILYLEYQGIPGKLEFINIHHVGFSLNKNKNKIDANDLINYLKNPKEYLDKTEMTWKEIADNNFSFKPNNLQKDIKGIRINDILSFSRHSIKLESEKEYFEITLKVHGQGIQKRCFRGKKAQVKFKKGKDFGSQRFVIKDEDFIYSTIDARNGCFSKIIPEVRNALYSNTYCCFKLKKDYQFLNLDFLTHLLNNEYFINYFEKISSGTSNRRSVKKNDFLNTIIPFNQAELYQYNDFFKKRHHQLKKIEKEKKQIKQQIEQKIKKLLMNKFEKI
ncbi:N-6 DNA methylase ['Cynodon dactylon' phytoplasma]|uniref:N-6 DNA methylase n=1 Tax='Cynodon dactylon' phytoplasma TaxID=295320 RepID=UPI001265B7FD|nr:N-6 DNA methylase ['Cynodon dactylon' phytoplasma]KAB8121692.1 N-6 DNA methylase ['Cynodon dactylon' phytoplasma]